MAHHNNKYTSAPFPHSRSRVAGSGMTLLSRPRTALSAAPRLAVPPPLNLPSLRKEHERSDPSSASATRGGGSAGGLGAGSSSMGWSKPVPPPLPEKPPGNPDGPPNRGDRVLGGGAYVPPGSRPDLQSVVRDSPLGGVSERAVILRGEEFPSLKATVVSKQKEVLKGRQLLEEKMEERDKLSESRNMIQMRPQIRSSALVDGGGKEKNAGALSVGLGSGGGYSQGEKFSSGPLPAVQLKHTSDWADDERDTALSLPERERGRGNSRSDLFHDVNEGRGYIDPEVGISHSRDFYKGDSFGRDLKITNSDSRDFGSWRSPLQSRNRFNNRDFGADRDRPDSRPLSAGREMGREGFSGQASFGDTGGHAPASTNQGNQYAKRDLGSPMKTSNGRVTNETFSGRFSEQNSRGRYGDNSNNWYKGNSFHSSNTVSKGQFSLGTKGGSFGDPFFNVSREKRSSSSNEKPYLEDSGFDSKDPYSEGISDVNVKMFKRKKDAVKQTDFYDPVRESFEAELESILRVQEQERQRIMEEQARVLEHARKEEEERQRLAREEDERRRLLEEETRNSAWRAELEKLEAARRTEEQRIAREEERRRYQLEEERRKEAAKQKLLEVEARMARRQAEEKVKDDKFTSSALSNDRMTVSMNERAVPRAAEVRDWEENERMVERLTSSASSDSSSMNKYFEGDSRPQSSRDGNTSSVDRGKYPYYNSTLFQEQENVHRSPLRDTFASRRALQKNDLHGGPSTISARLPMNVPVEPDNYHRQQRWNTTHENDHVKRNTEADFLDNDRFGEVGWTQSNSHGSSHNQFAERPFQNSTIDGFSSFTRYRQFLRQPRVPPPPSVQRSTHREHLERASSSSYTTERTHYNHPGRSELWNRQSGYESVNSEVVDQHVNTPLQEDLIHSANKVENLTPRCDSQSSVSVSTPPSSPLPLSHDEMDVAGDSPVLPTSADGDRTALSDNEYMGSTKESGVFDRITSSRSVSPRADDEWGVVRNKDMHDEEEYDEEGDDYQDTDENQEGEYYNLDLRQELEELHSDMQVASGGTEQVILGFDEGVEVKIPSNNELEITSKHSDDEFKVHAVSSSIMKELVDGSGNIFPGNNADSSLAIINETEKAMQELSLDAVTKLSYPEGCLSSGMPTQHTVGSTASLPQASSSSVPPIVSSSFPVSHDEAPIKLQFGLFSGPSLIPSPVPAIQIGSIRMPIPLPAQIHPSLPQMHPSQAPLFQFGQPRYPSPLSQSILPLAPQNVSFIRPQSPAPYSFNRNPVGSLRNQSTQDHTSQNNSRDGGSSSSAKLQGLIPDFPNSQENTNYKHLNDLEGNSVVSQNLTDKGPISKKKTTADSVSQSNHNSNDSLAEKRSYRSVSGKKDSQVQESAEPQSRFFPGGKAPPKAPGGLTSTRGKRYAYSTNSRQSFRESQASLEDANSIQRRARKQFRRTEFRVRENAERRQVVKVTEPHDSAALDEKQSINDAILGPSTRNLGKKDSSVSRSTKLVTESDDFNVGASVSRVLGYDGNVDKTTGKASVPKSSNSSDKSHAAEGNIKPSGNFEEDIDAPLQNGIVRVFNQPGIEIPDDEDDFIEVRYKRRMLNDRREQREKENKSKSRINKAPRKQHAVTPFNASASGSQKQVGRLAGDSAKGVNSNSAIIEGRALGKVPQSLGFSGNVISPTVTSAGAASAIDDAGKSSDKKLNQLMHTPAVSSCGRGLTVENSNVTAEHAALALNSWDKRNMDQQVMTLTQTQLDEAMKPAQFDSHVASNITLDNNKPISSSLAQEKSLTSSTSTINSLLAGEKIQFGAVTSPIVLPSGNLNISNGLGAPGSSRSDVKMSQTLASSNSNCTLFIGKDKQSGESRANLEDSEAEAAASAVAVAAISNDESVCPTITAPSESSSGDLKSFSNVDVTGLTSGGISLNVAGQQRANEEPLTVALPADLSVDTPALALWPSLPSPQGSGPMLSHFPGAAPSQFPCFEMNPILGGRIFAYGSHDEPAGTQGQSQRSLGIWPQCHTGVDSFYGPPGGFNGPFIGPGGIPGVQGPPHMVVYNHVAPVGQFGQLGLSFMGATYIPTGKQTEWKQSQASENGGDLCNATAVSAQTATPSMPTAPIQHLGPGSAIMPMPSPLTMFDVTPFQPSADVCWSHVPTPPFHSVPLSLPLQQQQQQQHHVEGAVPPQINPNLAIGTSSGNNRYNEHRPSVHADVNRNIQVANTTSCQLSDHLGVVQQPTSNQDGIQTIRPSHGSVSGNSKTMKNSRTSVINDGGGTGTSSNSNMNQSLGPPKSQQANSSSQRYLGSVGFTDQLGGASQKTSSSSEWHRRAGFHGRNQSSGGDKNFGPSKLKQIYVAKPSSGGHSSGQG